MRSNTNVARRLDFDRDAAGYTVGRQDADPATIRSVLSCSPSVHDVLEIGAGTGQATLALAAEGRRVVALEPGKNMAAELRRRSGTRKISVVTSDFESYAPDRTFDLVCSFDAYHWVRQPAGTRKVAGLLRAGGHLALAWSFRILAHEADQDRANEVFAAAEPDFARTWPTFERDSLRAIHEGQLETVESGPFDLVACFAQRRETTVGPDGYADFLASLANGDSVTADLRAKLRRVLHSDCGLRDLTIVSVYEKRP
ncbi:class I SAM-dependent methyltransferase [Fodinicola acaciae]|uniref:class I SAM-dependent methyltransferase n=1 Tax=Fodinicola acaciae TaxID=2681555 RepID=UPI0013D653F0|nr:class I SAM-dependent methyltransferase [Fodinicola acaciae]